MNVISKIQKFPNFESTNQNWIRIRHKKLYRTRSRLRTGNTKGFESRAVFPRSLSILAGIVHTSRDRRWLLSLRNTYTSILSVENGAARERERSQRNLKTRNVTTASKVLGNMRKFPPSADRKTST